MAIFELYPYGIWNKSITSRAFASCSFELYPYGIWNKRFERGEIDFLVSFELYPYGIWNYKYGNRRKHKEYLNFIPMGFETLPNIVRNTVSNIWTLSLWDLKLLSAWLFTAMPPFELYPYGIWNAGFLNSQLTQLDLNFIPMGFETISSFPNHSRLQFIWTLSLWDLKQNFKDYFDYIPGIWTLSLWDLKHRKSKRWR